MNRLVYSSGKGAAALQRDLQCGHPCERFNTWGCVLLCVQADVPEREPGIEYDADSEGELEELGLLVGGGQGVPSRVRMLHQLWALGVPRRRAA